MARIAYSGGAIGIGGGAERQGGGGGRSAHHSLQPSRRGSIARAQSHASILANWPIALIASAGEAKPVATISPNTASGVYSGSRSHSTSQLPTTNVHREEKYSAVKASSG